MFSFVVFLTLTSFHVISSIPILNNDETQLNSIVISEIILPTEASLVIADQEIVAEPASSFLDMVEKYEGMYGKEMENEFDLQKRSSATDDDSDDEKFDSDAGGKSLIDRIETPDPDVKKEFENELSHNQIIRDDDETTESAHDATEYDPIYERKMIMVSEKDGNATEISNDASILSVHEKENLQAQLVEQLVHQTENQYEFTTIVPEDSFTDHAIIKNPEIVEVLEHIVYESDNELKIHEHSTLKPINIVQMEVDPIEIIPKDRHREAKDEIPTDSNDKFAGFVGIPNEDLIQPGEETTESDNFFKSTDPDVDPIETVRETLEYIAIYGKSLNLDSVSTTTEISQTTFQISTLASIHDNKKEIVENNKKVTVNIQLGNAIESKKSSSSDESSQQSLSNKSSEENDSKEDKNKKNKFDNVSSSSEEIEAENVGKEDLNNERLNLRSLEFPVTQRPNALPEEIFKDLTVHEIKKKDHPDGLILPYEISGRQLNDEILGNDAITEVTMATVYEAFEDVVTTVSDGIKLSKEFTHQIKSFRVDSEENKIILDTHSEAISSKNSKNALVNVNDLEMMKLKERSLDEEPKLSIAMFSIVAVVSTIILIGLYKFIKVKAPASRLL